MNETPTKPPEPPAFNAGPLYQVRGPNATIRLYDDVQEAETAAHELNVQLYPDLSEMIIPAHSVITIRTEEGKAV